MAQMNWVFLDNFGGQHRVGLYHGDRSGHVVIHCSMRVVQIDFSIKESKMYSFFIEDELCEVILDKQHGVFGYEFRVNKKVDTPRNRDRRVEEGKTRKYMGILAFSVVFILLVAFLGLRRFGQQQDAKRVATTSIVSQYSKENMQRLGIEGKTTVARLHITQLQTEKGQKISYSLLALDSLMEQGDYWVKPQKTILLPNGFPLQEGDEFDAVYLPQEPGVHRVDFFQPTLFTKKRYLEQAILAEQKNNPAASPQRSACQVMTSAKLLGWQSLAHFIFQTTPPSSNPRNNQETYERLLQNSDLKQAYRENCQ